MIYVLSLNPCLDKSASIEVFQLDAPNRMQVDRRDIGGKGVNVARALTALGAPCLLTGFDYASGPVGAAMAREGVPSALTAAEGELRVNIKLREKASGRTLEISEQGASVSKTRLQAVEEQLLSLCRPGDWAALCGSLPPGAGKDTYRDLCRKLKERGCHVAVDCDGPALLSALDGEPDLIKPNDQEFSALLGCPAPKTGKEALSACAPLFEKGIGLVCLSLGPDGALLCRPGEAYFCPAADVPVLGTQGAGDSMLSGLLCSLCGGASLPKALQYASAAAGAAVSRPGTLLCTKEETERLLSALPLPVSCS